ncbi:MAG TPA: glucokinase [Roseiflexaceae bacterium]|nr:glucokinase [Roseiflexaceae bacterium]
MLLAGDIGGTKTVLAAFSAEAGPHVPLVEATFPSSRYGRLEAIVREFLAQVNLPVDRACFGVAGPVVAGTAEITNLPWVMSEASLKESFGWSAARLLNDLESIAYAVPILEPDDIRTLNTGAPVQHGNIAVIAPGTGLGEAFLTWERDHYRAHASEGGHASFAPSSDLEVGLLSYMRAQLGHGHVSFERVCSGLGIPNIYYYLKQSGYAEEPVWLAAALAGAADPTPVIMDSAMGKTERCQLTTTTLATFISILGAEAGNLALKVLSTAGVYLGGGIPPRLLASLEEPAFLEAFRHKGRFRDLLTEMPVHVILNPKTALLGAASYGLTM